MLDNNSFGCATARDTSRRCYMIVLSIIGALLAFAVGLILGAVFSATILAALPAVIVFAAILLVLLVVFYILRRCNTGR